VRTFVLAHIYIPKYLYDQGGFACSSSDYIHRDLCMVQERRTRISEKLRKLQDLVPNMDKVITTS